MSTTQPPTELDVLACELEGVRLIEASAGTGKTWAICALVLRLLLERRLEVRQILVVTFTNAACAELRTRIRARLVETLANLEGGAPATADPLVPRLLEMLRRDHGLADDELRSRIELALASFDEAAIYTIHGFCQRALAEMPFAARMPLRMELLDDDDELVLEAASDFWRQRVARDDLDPALAAWLVACKDSPQTFAALLARRLAKPGSAMLWPQGSENPAPADVAGLQAAHAAARARWLAGRQAIVDAVSAALPGMKATSYQTRSVGEAAAAWDDLLAGDDALAALERKPDKAALLATGRLAGGTKKGQATPVHPFFAEAQALLDARQAATRALALSRFALLRTMLAQAGRALHEAKRRRRVMSFDDLLVHLERRLQADDGAGFAQVLRERFPAALIDEFQDTDPVQFAVFSAVYRGALGPLMLIGDPKQAIYGFRSADLHTYLGARSLADAGYTLLGNQRSTGELIGAVNALFGANPRAFMQPGIDFRPAGEGQRRPAPLVDRSGPAAALQVWLLPEDPEAGAPMLRARAEQAVVRATAAEVARLLAAGARGEVTLDGRALRAGDVAVLVRRHAEGRAMRDALAALGVGSVELSQASVFRSADAEEVDRVLRAVLEPTRERLLRAALATEAMGHDAAQIDALAADEGAWLRIAQRFAAYRQSWLEKGVGPMLHAWLAGERVAERLLARADGERRLTNLLHLVELAHAAAGQHPSPDALLRWLQSARRQARAGEEAQLRLESDRHLAQVVTVHKSKGLEYPVVFCPFLWRGRHARARDPLGDEYHDENGRAVIDLRTGEEADEAAIKRQVALEAATDDLRLAYVAVTRAVHRCVLVAGSYAVGTAGGGRSSAESSRNVLNWLAAGDGHSPEDWLSGSREPAVIAAAWAALAARHAPGLSVAPLPDAPGVALGAPCDAAARLEALAPPATPPAGWRIGSYSSMLWGATHERAAADHDLRAGRDAASAGPAAARTGADAPAPDDILGFARGAAAGVCLHAVFEHAEFSDPASWPAAIARALRTLPPQAPGGGPRVEAARAARMLERMLGDVLSTPLPVGTARPLVLAGVPASRRLAELEFHLPAHDLAAPALNALLQRLGVKAPRLDFARLRGYLVGHIDLVVEHNGRYFVVDWKSNHLGDRPADYGERPLAAAMVQHGYHLQSLLYGVALDRHLRRCLPGYEPEMHFGGSLYLFVRGVRPLWTDDQGRPTGVHFHRPGAATLAELSSLLDAPGAAR